jgi:CRISPR-associated protein Cst2
MSEESVYEIAILGRIIWNLHSLNNEGTVGNVTEPRNLRIIDPNTGEVVTTDGISGEMLKHIHAERIWELEAEKDNFCEACKQLKPEKADGVEEVKKSKKPEEAVEKALKCELCDIHGFLIQQPTVARSSVVEFGWALGIPQVLRDIHTHARHSPHEETITIEEEKEVGSWGDEKCSTKGCKTDPAMSKLFKVKDKWYCEEHLPERAIQMIYHRPTRSGRYAIVSVFQPWRIGLNNVTMDYVKNINRENRYRLVLKAYQSMFTKTGGAMTSTRLPHTTNFSGIIVVAKNNISVPVISPLKENYIDEVKEISKTLKGIDVIEFGSVSEFVKRINDLESKKPYSIKTK